jgi:predicted transcriptional regulator
MIKKTIKTRTITIQDKEGSYYSIFNRFRSEPRREESNVSVLRTILAPEKARMLHALKTRQPNSIYELAKILARDFKSVRQDIAILEKFGLVEMIPIYKGKREKLKPLLVLDVLEIRLEL